MGLYDMINYTLFTNPLSASAASYATSAAVGIRNYMKPKAEVKMVPPVPLWKLAAASGPYVRLAAISGAVAVIIGAYGAHREYSTDKLGGIKLFETASRYHFIHTLALLGLPLCRAPFLAATFFLSGIVLFSGSCYYYAFTGDRKYNKVTPIGGVCFIIGWLSVNRHHYTSPD